MTILELLVSLVIGLGVLAAGLAFLNNTSRSIQIGQESAANTSVAQQALNRMVKELKGVHVANPSLMSITPAWTDLPALPYTALELYPYPATSGQVMDPAAPAARKFASQSTPLDIYHKWYPNPNGAESNSLVFYKAPATAPGNVSQVERITYRLQGDRLLREVQRPLSSSATSFVGTPAPLVTVLAKEVQQIQFTYPDFARQMTAAVDTQLNDLLADEGNAVLQRHLNETYRKVIGIRIVMAGAQISGSTSAGIELQTEVRLRSE